MFAGLFTSKFERFARALAAAVNMNVSDIDDDSAIYTPNGRYSHYPVMLSVTDGGAVILSCFSRAHWTGREPAAAHTLMEKLDGESDRISFRVFRGNSGRARCTAMTRVGSPGALTADLFSELAADLIGGMVLCDRVLREHGYA
jgi:hypothetical protein